MRVVALALFAIDVCNIAAAFEKPTRIPAPTDVSTSVAFDAHLLADQFGYRPHDPKVAVIRNPQLGYDSTNKF